MNSIRFILLLFLLPYTPKHLATAATAIGTAQATVVTPLIISTVQNINFNTINPNNNTSTHSTRSTHRSTQIAKFKVRGEPNSNISIHLNQNHHNHSPTQTSMKSGSNHLNTTLSIPHPNLQKTTDNSGELNIAIAGSIHLAQNQPSGQYITTYIVGIMYQ